MDPHDPPLRRPGQLAPEEVRARSRDHGIRQVRRLSNWTAAALVAATAVTAGYFGLARHGSQGAAAVTGSHVQAPGSSSGRPCVTAPVAVSGGSGVTTTTVPAQSCAPGTSTGTRPAVVEVKQGGNRED